MKLLIFILATLFFQFSFAANDPTQFCNESLCTPQMQSITEQFKAGSESFIHQKVSGYSGECFHLNQQYDPEMAHHGAFVFEATERGVTATGVFSFFAGTDPYAGESVSQMKEELLKVSHPDLLTQTSDPVILDFSYPESEITYWFRSSKDQNQLMVIGQEAQGFTRNKVFCRMQAH